MIPLLHAGFEYTTDGLRNEDNLDNKTQFKIVYQRTSGLIPTGIYGSDLKISVYLHFYFISGIDR